MGEPAVSAHLKAISDKLADEAFNKYVTSHEIRSDLKILGRKLSLIQPLLNDASEKVRTHKVVGLWLSDLQRVAYEIDNVLDDVDTEAMHPEVMIIPTRYTNFSPTHELHQKLDSIITKLEHLYKATADLGLVVKDEKPKNTSRRNETSLPDVSVVGRQLEVQKLLNKLLGDDGSSKEKFSIVPIVGMGGVGKTTLARLVYNDAQVKDHFEVKAWVCVFVEFDVFKISKTIFQDVANEYKEFENLNQLQIALKKKLEDKRFLIVFDDVWTGNYEDWEHLLRPFYSAAPGSKIIMTTRKTQLLKKLGVGHFKLLHSLSDDDALSLLAQHALGLDNFDLHPTLKPPGESIMKKCSGLPLALKAIGRLLRTKTDREAWDDVLNSEMWNLDDGINPALKISYYDLSSDLKRLFAYCSLFPKDFLFDKEELVLLWMAEGFLNQLDVTKSPEWYGYQHFEALLSRSFFERAPNDKDMFVMHDIMNDLAVAVAGDYCLRFDEHMKMTKKALAKYLHMSFDREEYVAYHEFEAFKRATSLRTLLAVSFGTDRSWDAFYLSSKILVDLLPELPMLRVLCLSRFEISEVPDFIGNLKHLRYLNLSQTKIKELPENVGNLLNLQTLIVFGCQSLAKLPASFIKLKKLRYFDTRDTPLLEKLPMGIGDLKSLHILTKIIIGEDNGFAITELKGLKNLHGQISIRGLHNVQDPMQAREANLSLKRLTKLELEWDGVSKPGTLEKEVLNELKPDSDRLKELVIVSYGGTEFPKWVGHPSFHQLVRVSIRNCINCTSLPPLGQLPSLKGLFIQGMDEIEFIGSELTGTADIAFPSLEILVFEDMPSWHTWSTNCAFPCLRELQVIDCPRLIDVLVGALPSLRVLQIDRCGDGVLSHLVKTVPLINKLKVESVFGLTDEVWRGVMDYLGEVEELRIYRCNEIKYLWESKAYASRVLLNLKKLYVYNCSNLVSLGEKEEEDNLGSNLLSSLLILDIWHCNNMERCCCPNSIESLCIGSCSSVTHICFPTTTTIEGGQKLRSLDISLCNKQMEKINNISMSMLECVYIHHWTNLKSIIQLSTSIHLTHLELYGCPSIESFPDLEISELTSLQYLLVEKCPRMDYSFPRGLWPPNLVSLGIGGLKKPISEWGPQNFPTSLVELTLFGEDVSSFSELSHLLPSTLTRLRIEEFDKLGSLSMGLQHLISLKHLNIEKCPKIIYLPEWLLPSLLSLRIYECPDLEERCNGRGSHYWPLISHIPCIDLED